MFGLATCTGIKGRHNHLERRERAKRFVLTRPSALVCPQSHLMQQRHPVLIVAFEIIDGVIDFATAPEVGSTGGPVCTAIVF